MSDKSIRNFYTNKGRYYFFLDILRCYAVLSVVFFHFPIISNNYFFKYVYDCVPGVPLFFTISGFLITKILLEKRGNRPVKELLKTFYIRRILRIFPVYYLTIFLLLLSNYRLYKNQLLYDLFYLSNIKIGLDGGYQNTIAPHFWSLSVEEQFYLFWPLVVLSFIKRNIKVMSLILFFTGIITLIVSSYISSHLLFFVNRTIGSFSYIGLGCFLAYLYLETNLLLLFKKHKGKSAIFIGFIFLSGFFYFSKNAYFAFFFSFFVIAFLILLSISKKEQILLKRFNFLKPFIFIGKVSYGIYIYHFFSADILHSVKIKLPISYGVDWFNIFVCLFSIVLAIISWYTIEKYFLRFKKKYQY